VTVGERLARSSPGALFLLLLAAHVCAAAVLRLHPSRPHRATPPQPVVVALIESESTAPGAQAPQAVAPPAPARPRTQPQAAPVERERAEPLPTEPHPPEPAPQPLLAPDPPPPQPAAPAEPAAPPPPTPPQPQAVEPASAPAAAPSSAAPLLAHSAGGETADPAPSATGHAAADAAGPAASSAGPAAPPPSAPPRVGAAYLDNPKPAYPLSARHMRLQGTVRLRVLVTAQGTVDHVEVQTTSGSPMLDRSALDAVRRWRFVPARHGDAAVPAWVVVPIVFTLEG
jgi:protein TonB